MTAQTLERPASPTQVRAGLTLISAAAATELTLATSNVPIDQLRAVLFEVTPVVVDAFSVAGAALSVDWYEDLREAAAPPRRFAPTVDLRDRTSEIRTAVALATPELHDPTAISTLIPDADEYMARVMADIKAEAQKAIAEAMREAVTENVARDPDAVGWRRFARAEACKFCLMLAARGAVYTEATARFAAHGAVMSGNRKGGNCMCIAGPAFGGQEIWAEATPMQYVASQVTRTPEQRKKLREYLRANFPDAPG